MDLIEHLRSRDLKVERYSVHLSEADGIATFMLYNFSGKLVGYQTYNPNGPKIRNNHDPRLQRYFTYFTSEGYKKAIGFFGLDTYDPGKKYLFLTEGIFDAVKLHNLGLNAFALLSNDPKRHRSWLRILPHRRVAVCDGDAAGLKLAKMGHEHVVMPEGKDLGDMNEPEIKTLLRRYI